MEKVLSMAEWEIFDIQVALKIIKHISAGIYRTPGGIIKELVNNSYDAGATTVEVSSGYPEFSTIKIKDNGDGMTKDSLEFSFMHVGASQKVLEDEYPAPFGRKIVGMFGIGMLAAVHASPHILMRTFPKGKNYGLEAMLDLSPYFEYVNQIKTLEEFKFGTIKYKTIERGPKDKGTEIILYDIDKRSNFYKAISKKANLKKSKMDVEFVKWPLSPNSKDDNGNIMASFVETIDEEGVRSVEDLCGRDRFLWELGLITPVEYLEDGPIKKEYLNSESRQVISGIKEELKSLNFSVFFDGVQLRKPISLPSTKLRTSGMDEIDTDSYGDVTVFPISIEAPVDDFEEHPPVIAVGYVIHQPYRISPLELMGFYPRVKYVGVGRYDNNFFRVIHGEQPILRAQLSGELFVKEGLDEALNLDREGFIEIDAGYQVLRDNLKGIIQENENSIVKEAKKSSNNRRERRLGLKEAEQKKNVQVEVKEILKELMPQKTVEFKEVKQPSEKANSREYSSVGINSVKDGVELSISDLRIEDSRTISLIVKVDSMLSGNQEFEKLREEFRRIVNELFQDY